MPSERECFEKNKNRILLFTMLVKPMPEPGEGGYSRSLKTKWKRY
jgi:hypothetical protein